MEGAGAVIEATLQVGNVDTTLCRPEDSSREDLDNVVGDKSSTRHSSSIVEDKGSRATRKNGKASSGSQ